MPDENGSVTPSVAAVATAASTAFPPARRTWRPTAVAVGSTVATAPPYPIAVGCWASAARTEPGAVSTPSAVTEASAIVRRKRIVPPQGVGGRGRAPAYRGTTRRTTPGEDQAGHHRRPTSGHRAPA